ncbi:MAG: hypothetical protein LBB61_10255 [Treponema sp.]|jgi:hypothetical protein|nr:hypothetical protein [Treponema sp.]
MRIRTDRIFGIFLISLPFFLFFLFSLNGCGETSLDTILYLPFNPYKMSVFLDEKQQPIDNIAIINSGDTIRPYFLNSRSERDSDVTGFQVFLQTADRAIRKERLVYTFTRPASPMTEDAAAAATEITGPYWTENIPVFVPVRSVELPAFILPETLGAGQYSMLFQVVGKDGVVLSSTEKPFHFLADAHFVVKDPQVYLPGEPDMHIATADTHILLTVPVVWDERLDPYIVWYEGSKEFGAGKVSEGANRIVWTVPKLTGFKNISAEVFPFQPFEGSRKASGITGTISIPIMVKKAESGYFDAAPDESVH